MCARRNVCNTGSLSLKLARQSSIHVYSIAPPWLIADVLRSCVQWLHRVVLLVLVLHVVLLVLVVLLLLLLLLALVVLVVGEDADRNKLMFNFQGDLLVLAEFWYSQSVISTILATSSQNLLSERERSTGGSQ